MQLLIAGLQDWGIVLTDIQRQQFELYYRELMAWNQRFNLTAITAYEEVQLRHFLDSLSAVHVLGGPLTGQTRVIDVGAGAGFPAVPLKILYPEAPVVLVESIAKKCRFLEHVSQALGLGDVEVVNERAELVAHDPAHREVYDWVLARAVDKLSILVELTLPFARIGGRVVAYKQTDVADELAAADIAIGALGGRLQGVVQLTVDTLERALVVIEKVSPTLSRHPRRPGMPQKRPLGGRSQRLDQESTYM